MPAELIPPAPVLSVEDALKTFTLAEGYVIEPVVAEPLVEKPVALSFDANGNIWVVEMRGYMPDLDGKGEEKPQGRIAVLQDTDDDGQIDKRTVFWDHIHLPRSVAVVEGGALIADHTSLYFAPREGVVRSGEPVLLDNKYAPSGNVEHRANGMMRHLNNWFYNAKSSTRYLWRKGKLTKDSTQFRGQWGITMDDFGRIFHNNNSTLLRGDELLPDLLETFSTAKFKPDASVRVGSNRVYPIRVTPGVNRGYIAKINGYDQNTLDPKTHKLINTTAAAGPAIYRGDNFPTEDHGLAFTTESVVNLVKATRITSEGNRLSGKHLFKGHEFLASTDERFRPVNVYTAPDGCLYLVDYYHGIIQHKTYMTSYLRAQYEARGLGGPSYGLGRIYRIRHADTPRGPQPKLADASIVELVETLTHPNGWWRDTAQRLLVEREDASSVPLLQKALNAHPEERTRIHALWALEGMRKISHQELAKILTADNNEGLQKHALAVALTLSEDERLQLKDVTLPLVAENKSTTPYALRLLASLPASHHSTLADTFAPVSKTKYAAEAVTSGLLVNGVRVFPKTKSAIDKHITAFVKNTAKVPAIKRLKGEHLASFKRGQKLYLGEAACTGCHGGDGLGLPNLGPPLDESEWVTESPERLTKILLHGMAGPLTVNGVNYKPLAAMPGLAVNPSITDDKIADIITYIRAEWSNTASQVTTESVTAVRNATKDRAGRVYTSEELRPKQ